MSKERGISSADSSLKGFVVHTDEELIIARETARLIEDNRKIVNARDARLKRIASKEWNMVESSVFITRQKLSGKTKKRGRSAARACQGQARESGRQQLSDSRNRA